MSNEELAVRIKAGERDLMTELWGQVRDLIAWFAVRQYNATEGFGGVEVEDLIQTGYIALVEAVETFDQGAGYKFSTWLKLPLKSAFAEAGGYRSVRRDAIDYCDSLDRPVQAGDDDTLGDLQPAPGDCFEDAERRIWLEQLRGVLDSAMAALPADWRDTLERRYYRGQSLRTVAGELRERESAVRGREQKALYRLHHERRRNGLGQFWDERAIDMNTPWYLHVGPEEYNSTGTSAVEKIVIKREREQADLAALAGGRA